MHRTFAAASLTIALAAAAPVAAGVLEEAHCSSGAVGEVKTYLSIDNVGSGDTRANANGNVRLRGWLYIPSGTPPAGGFSVIIFNHGSEEEPAAKCVFADYFVAKEGYALFVPVRRGHTGSSGEYVVDYAERKADETCQALPPDVACDRDYWVNYWKIEYLKDQKQDVKDAIIFVKTQAQVNKSKIAVMGHSFGGIVTLFMNTLDGDDTKAVVDISGGAQSWDGNSYARNEMKKAVEQAKRPIFFLQPKNDVSIDPTVELSYVAGKMPMRYQAAIFANVPDSLIQPCPRPDSNDPSVTLSCGDVAHGVFVSDPDQIKKWGATVVDFLTHKGVN